MFILVDGHALCFSISEANKSHSRANFDLPFGSSNDAGCMDNLAFIGVFFFHYVQ